jgi:hypothetical protein
MRRVVSVPLAGKTAVRVSGTERTDGIGKTGNHRPMRRGWDEPRLETRSEHPQSAMPRSTHWTALWVKAVPLLTPNFRFRCSR